MKQVAVLQPGGPEQLRIEEAPVPEPGAGEVLLRVHAAGVNRPDLLQRSGSYPPPPGASPILGLETAGLVEKTGPGCTALRPGDAVCALVPGGGYAEFCAVPEGHCLPLPRGWSMEEAAGLPETFFTVWANVFQIGGLKAGESFLVHGGASGIGTTAIQLAGAFGAEAYATAGSAAKCAVCRELGAALAVNYREVDFEREILKARPGGMDVILDMVGGDYAAKNVACLAPRGRLVQIATQQGPDAALNLSAFVKKRLTLAGSALRPRSIEEKASIARELREKVWPLLDSRKVRVIVDRVFSLEEVRQAHERLESGQAVGKVILRLGERA